MDSTCRTGIRSELVQVEFGSNVHLRKLYPYWVSVRLAYLSIDDLSVSLLLCTKRPK